MRPAFIAYAALALVVFVGLSAANHVANDADAKPATQAQEPRTSSAAYEALSPFEKAWGTFSAEDKQYVNDNADLATYGLMAEPSNVGTMSDKMALLVMATKKISPETSRRAARECERYAHLYHYRGQEKSHDWNKAGWCDAVELNVLRHTPETIGAWAGRISWQ